MAATALAVLADASQFGNGVDIRHDSEYVQVTLEHFPAYGQRRTYARAVRRREGLSVAWTWAAEMARHVEEVASLVSSAQLASWLQDSGFQEVR